MPVTLVKQRIYVFMAWYLVKIKIKIVRVIFVTEHHAMKAYWGSGGIASRILDFGTKWR
jgi:hypothetical protein